MNRPKKSLGQNFLIDNNVINKIIKLVKIKNSNILEIGPGTGNLTDKIIAQKPKSLILIEKDKTLYENLKKKYKNFKEVVLLNEDVLSINLEKILKTDTVVFGNLPYNISTQILVKFIKFEKWLPKFYKLIFMFQKEVAERLEAKSNTTKYGRLSVISKWRLKIKDQFDVSKNSFYPKPKVESKILVFTPVEIKSSKILQINTLEEVTRVLFSNKRKMINKAFSKLFNKSEIIAKDLKIDLSSRPGELEESDFYKIAEKLENCN